MRPSIAEAIAELVKEMSHDDWGNHYGLKGDGANLKAARDRLERVLNEHIETVVAQKLTQLIDKDHQETSTGPTEQSSRIMAMIKRTIRPPRSL